MKVYIEPHGCAMSYGEAEIMRYLLEEKGHAIVSDIYEADAVILHTCIVIESTERKMITRLKKFAGTGKILIVSGCMVGAREKEILETAPECILIQPGDIARIQNMIENTSELHSAIPRILIRSAHEYIDGGKNNISKNLTLDATVISTIPIATGCVGNCDFCITRIARGALKSYSYEEIVRWIKYSVSRGAKEIRLAAQDTACYGRDTGDSLPELLRKILEIDNSFKIRIGMMNVNTLMPIIDELIEIYKNKKIFKFLHLPVQSGSNEILEKMNRQYTAENFEYAIERFRLKFPDLTLSTDAIAGFPGESEHEFMQTVALLKKTKPDIINIKGFSPRYGTSAWYMKNRLNSRIVKQRTKELAELKAEISMDNLKRYVGDNEEVLVVEHGKNETVVGRTLSYKPVVIDRKIPLGSFVNVKITEAESCYLKGVLV